MRLKRLHLFPAGALAALLPLAAQAQQSSPPPILAVTQMKIKEGKTSAFLKFSRETSKPVLQAMVDAGVISSSALYLVRMSTSGMADYDTVRTLTYPSMAGLGAVDAASDERFKKATGMTTDEYFTTRASLAATVRQIHLMGNVSVGGPGSKVWRLMYHKAEAGKLTDALDEERSTWKPIHEEEVKGGRMKAWAVASSFPACRSPRHHSTMSPETVSWNSATWWLLTAPQVRRRSAPPSRKSAP